MRRLTRLWSALEAGLAAERLEWQRRLEDEWPVAEALLRRVGRIAEQVWCPSPGGDGCPRQVVRHNDGRIVAVCGDRPKRCDPLDLEFEDLVVFEVDWRKLGNACARIFDVDTTTNAKLSPGFYRLGEHLVASGSGFPVVLLIPEEFRPPALGELPPSLEGLGIVVLLTPTRRLLGEGLHDALKVRGGCAVPLTDTVGADDAGALATLRPTAEIFGMVRERLIQQRKIKAPEHYFPTPPGTSWRHVSIRFLSGHDVHIQARGRSGGYDFTQMGLANTRKKPAEPDVQWKLLLAFAENGGEITWRDSAADRKLEKRKQLLAKCLRAFFGIDDEPFEKLPNGLGWRARFVIMADV